MVKEIIFVLDKEIGVLFTNVNGWTKEMYFVFWNDGVTKYDLHDWNRFHEKMGKSDTLTENEIQKQKILLNTEI